MYVSLSATHSFETWAVLYERMCDAPLSLLSLLFSTLLADQLSQAMMRNNGLVHWAGGVLLNNSSAILS